eukprot:4303632-Prymnesium_polylepis.1
MLRCEAGAPGVSDNTCAPSYGCDVDEEIGLERRIHACHIFICFSSKDGQHSRYGNLSPSQSTLVARSPCN